MGPYSTEEAAAAEAMPRAVALLHSSGLVRSGDPDGLVRRAQLAALIGTCEAVGVDLGAYDVRVLEWLARGEACAVQVVAGLIARAAGTISR